ncbi:hypothetical protein ACFL6S_27945 [Candidatus Poribacteria bacterium]
MRIDTENTRQFYRRLNHPGYGVTELVVIDPNGEKGIIATGLFNNEHDFVEACQAYSGRYNIYAGRNPRPRWFPKVCMNYLDRKRKHRARDMDIEYITAISLDIDPMRPKGTSATIVQHKKAIEFATKLHHQLGGWVDDSGNGAYLWLPFRTAIPINDENRDEMKGRCKLWQANIVKAHEPEKHGLRIDGCFDLSRLKKVMGTQSMKGHVHRLSRFVIADGTRDDKVRNAIISISSQAHGKAVIHVKPSQNLPAKFLKLLKTNRIIQQLWLTPDAQSDASMHDWFLGTELAKAGIVAEDMARILMLNPFGKYQRDRRYSYIQSTVRNLVSKCSDS